MVALCQAVARRPMDRNALRKAANDIQGLMGENALTEAACTVGGMELMTRVADTTGKRPKSPIVLSIVSLVLSLIRWILSFFQ